MDEGIVDSIAEWSNGSLNDEALGQHLQESLPDLQSHKAGFQQVVDDLLPAQKERCSELIRFCFETLDEMFAAIDQALEGIEAQDRNTVFIAGDTIARNSFQLNQAFAEFRNQALVALGPTDIPNYNLLLSRRDEYLDEPTPHHGKLFLEAIDAERIVVYHSLEDLAKEPDITEVKALINAFRSHMKNLNSLAEMLDEQAEEGDYDTLYDQLDITFEELRELVPVVQMTLRAQGETDFPDLNYLFNLMEDVSQGNIGDGPLLAALESIDESFSKSRDDLAQACGHLKSALANDELEAVLETYEEFEEGMEATYKFLEERDRAWLAEAKGCLLDFARRFSAHQKKLREIEEQMGKVLCPKCANYNDSHRARCHNCGGPLPQNVAADTVSTFEAKEEGALDKASSGVLVTANLEKLYVAVNQVAEGSLDLESFLDEVDRFENLVEASVGSLPEEPTVGDDSEQAEVESVYDDYENGVESLRRAIDTFRAYSEVQDEDILTRAVREVDEGARLIARAAEATR